MAQRTLQQLNAAQQLADLAVFPGNRLEALEADRQGQHSIRVNDQYRVCFVWRDGDAYDVEIVDDHERMEGSRMTRKSRRLPPVHPGEILREDLMDPLGLSINGLARNLRVPVTRMSEIVNGRRPL